MPDYNVEWSLGETIILQGSSPKPNPQWSEGITILDWKLIPGMKLIAVTLSGLTIEE